MKKLKFDGIVKMLSKEEMKTIVGGKTFGAAYCSCNAVWPDGHGGSTYSFYTWHGSGCTIGYPIPVDYCKPFPITCFDQLTYECEA